MYLRTKGLGEEIFHLNGRQRVFLFYLTDSRRPPTELKVASQLSDQNHVITLYAIISVLNANFYENINAHY